MTLNGSIARTDEGFHVSIIRASENDEGIYIYVGSGIEVLGQGQNFSIPFEAFVDLCLKYSDEAPSESKTGPRKWTWEKLGAIIENTRPDHNEIGQMVLRYENNQVSMKLSTWNEIVRRSIPKLL